MKVKLQDVIDALGFTNDEDSYFYDGKTGEVLFFSADLDAEDELDEDGRDDYIPLPSQYDRNDYQIMEAFIAELPAGAERDELTTNIQGRGAFRMFRATVTRLGRLDDWYRFKDVAYRKLAIQWCEEHDITYV